MHRIIFCGDREWKDIHLIGMVMAGLQANLKRFVVIEGEAKGADILSKECAKDLGLPFKKFPADWVEYKKAAGAIRNTQMLKEGKATACVAFHKDIENSKGTKNMVMQARKAGLPVWICTDGPKAFMKFIQQLKESK